MEKTASQIQIERVEAEMRRLEILKAQLELHPNLAEASTEELQKDILKGAAAQELLFARQNSHLAITAAPAAPSTDYQPVLPAATARIEPVEESPKTPQTQYPAQPQYAQRQPSSSQNDAPRQHYPSVSSFSGVDTQRSSVINAGSSQAGSSSSTNSNSGGQWSHLYQQFYQQQQKQQQQYQRQQQYNAPIPPVSRAQYVPYGTSRSTSAMNPPHNQPPRTTSYNTPNYHNVPAQPVRQSQASNPRSQATPATSYQPSVSQVPSRPASRTQQNNSAPQPPQAAAPPKIQPPQATRPRPINGDDLYGLSGSQLPPNAMEFGYFVIDPSLVNVEIKPKTSEEWTVNTLMKEFLKQLTVWTLNTPMGARAAPLTGTLLSVQRTGPDVARLMMQTNSGSRPPTEAELLSVVKAAMKPTHPQPPASNPTSTVPPLPRSTPRTVSQESRPPPPAANPKSTPIPNTVLSDSTASNPQASNSASQNISTNTNTTPSIPQVSNPNTSQPASVKSTVQRVPLSSSAAVPAASSTPVPPAPPKTTKPVPPQLARNILRALGVSVKDDKRGGDDATAREGTLRGSKRQRTMSRTSSPSENPVTLSVLPTTPQLTRDSQNASSKAVPDVQTSSAPTQVPPAPIISFSEDVQMEADSSLGTNTTSVAHAKDPTPPATTAVSITGTTSGDVQAPISVEAGPSWGTHATTIVPTKVSAPVVASTSTDGGEQLPTPSSSATPGLPMTTTFVNSTSSHPDPVRVAPPKVTKLPQPYEVRWVPPVTNEVSTSHRVGPEENKTPTTSRPVSPEASLPSSPKSALFLPSSSPSDTEGNMHLQYPEADEDEDVQEVIQSRKVVMDYVLMPVRPAWVQAEMDRRQDITRERLRAVKISVSRLRELHCRWGNCGSVLNSTAALRAHVLVHCEEKGRCQWILCIHSSSTVGDLQRHLQEKHAGTYSCAYQKCDRVFLNSRHLLSHHTNDHKKGTKLRPAATLSAVHAAHSELPTIPEKLPSYMSVPLTFRLPAIPRAQFMEESQELLRHLMGKPRVPSTRSHRRIPSLMEARSKGTFEYESMHRRSDGNGSTFAKIRGLEDLPSLAVTQWLKEGRFVYPPPRVDEIEEEEEEDEIDCLPHPEGSASRAIYVG